jgi:PAS domain S-box-containing protein
MVTDCDIGSTVCFIVKQTEIDPTRRLRSMSAAGSVPVPGAGADAELDLARLIAEAGTDVDQVTELMVRACAGIPHELIVLLLTDPTAGGLQAARVRHLDERRGMVLQARLGVEMKTLNASLDAAGRPGVPVPVDGDALPEPVQAVLAEERPGPVMVVPVLGRLAILGVLVVARGGPKAFTDSELDHVLSAGRLCGQALENIRSAGDAARAGTLVRMLRDAVITVDVLDVVTHWNEAAEEMYGISAAEATGHRLHDLIRGVFWEGDALSARSAVLSQGRWQGQVRHTSRVGRVVEVLCADPTASSRGCWR